MTLASQVYLRNGMWHVTIRTSLQHSIQIKRVMADTMLCKSEDNSIHDDSGTDALYIALDDTSKSLSDNVKEEETSQSSELENEKLSTERDPPKTFDSSYQSPLITDYPRPFLPSYPLPPPPACYYPVHPMFLPTMMPPQHPGLPHYQPATINAHHSSGFDKPTEANNTGRYIALSTHF